MSGMGRLLKTLRLITIGKSGTPSIDPSTGIITLTGHGFSGNDAIEFGAGTGAVPTGILAYDSTVHWSTYYNVINVSGDTFQITNTLDGSTPVVPSDAGTAGWQIRSGQMTSLQVTGLDLQRDKAYEIICILYIARRGSVFIPTLNFKPTDANYYYFTPGSTTSSNPKYEALDLTNSLDPASATAKRCYCVSKIKVAPVGFKMSYDISSNIITAGAEHENHKIC